MRKQKVIKLPTEQIRYILPFIHYKEESKERVRQVLEKLIETTGCLLTIAIIPLKDAIEYNLLLTTHIFETVQDMQKNILIGTFHFSKADKMKENLEEVVIHLKKINNDILDYLKLIESEKPEIIKKAKEALSDLKQNIKKYEKLQFIAYE